MTDSKYAVVVYDNKKQKWVDLSKHATPQEALTWMRRELSPAYLVGNHLSIFDDKGQAYLFAEVEMLCTGMFITPDNPYTARIIEGDGTPRLNLVRIDDTADEPATATDAALSDMEQTFAVLAKSHIETVATTARDWNAANATDVYGGRTAKEILTRCEDLLASRDAEIEKWRERAVKAEGRLDKLERVTMILFAKHAAQHTYDPLVLHGAVETIAEQLVERAERAEGEAKRLRAALQTIAENASWWVENDSVAGLTVEDMREVCETVDKATGSKWLVSSEKNEGGAG